ncbi:MAG: radical SAM protein [Ruminococcus sp.]|nr:radical SAM protein [Ruminococcus sp.]
MSTLRIAWFTADTRCLGPGARFALWVQGCCRKCEGCIAPSLQDTAGGKVSDTAEILREIAESGAEGLTISGGEPFLQAEPLGELVKAARRLLPGLNVIVYTGFTYEQLRENPSAAGLLAETDLLIDGEYVRELDDGLPMRGSSNQRLIFLTNRLDPGDMPDSRTNKIIFTEKGFRMVGIPSKGAKELLGIMQEG